jgi:DNA helicase-2/ATP-dependent DNA helicase PcrA
MSYEWSSYQKDIFDFVKNNDKNVLVQACAGSGKSTTLEHTNKLFSSMDSIINVCFNKHIAEDMRKRLPFYREVNTLNSVFWRVCRENVRNARVSEGKNFFYLQKHFNMNNESDIKQFWKIQSGVTKIVSLFKQLNLQSWPNNWESIASNYGVETGDFDPSDQFDFWCEKVYTWSINSPTKTKEFDFADQLYQVVRNNWHFLERDVVTIDECQDLSPIQIALVPKLGERVIAVGDPNQAIYVFRGADIEAVPKLIAKISAAILPLSVCYRCPVAVIDEVKHLVPEIESAPNARQGYVGHSSIDEYWDRVQYGDYVLCRTTAPLVSKCLEGFRNHQMKGFVRGRDIGENIERLIDKIVDKKSFAGDSVIEFVPVVNDYRGERLNVLNGCGKFIEAQNLDDQVETILAFAQDCSTLCEMKVAIKKIFSDKDNEGVEYSTVHKAKGREKANVFTIRDDLCPHPKTPQHLLQIERNLQYVRDTRAQENLIRVIE